MDNNAGRTTTKEKCRLENHVNNHDDDQAWNSQVLQLARWLLNPHQPDVTFCPSVSCFHCFLEEIVQVFVCLLFSSNVFPFLHFAFFFIKKRWKHCMLSSVCHKVLAFCKFVWPPRRQCYNSFQFDFLEGIIETVNVFFRLKVSSPKWNNSQLLIL